MPVQTKCITNVALLVLWRVEVLKSPLIASTFVLKDVFVMTLSFVMRLLEDALLQKTALKWQVIDESFEFWSCSKHKRGSKQKSLWNQKFKSNFRHSFKEVIPFVLSQHCRDHLTSLVSPRQLIEKFCFFGIESKRTLGYFHYLLLRLCFTLRNFYQKFNMFDNVDLWKSL